MPTPEQIKNQIVGIVFPIIGVTLLGVAAVSAIYTYRFISVATRTTGQVIKANGAHVDVSFVPKGEKSPIEFHNGASKGHQVGDRVSVLYVIDPSYPTGFQTGLDELGSIWFGTMVITWLGGGFVLGGWYSGRLARSKAKADSTTD